ncbi:MAG: NACHT domain-containing protein [Chloroflexota bacterium]
MDPVVTPLLALVLGNLAREVITEACKGYLTDKAKSVFGWIAQLGEGDKLELAYQDALEQASGVCLDTLLQNIKGAGYTDEELKEYRDSLKAFIKDKQVLAELLESIRDLNDKERPSPEVLRERWYAVGGQDLPDEIVWNSVTAAFRRRAIKQSLLSDELRELLNAQTMQEVKELLERQGGVKVQVRKDRYALRMRTRFAPVDLANLMPAYAEDPGRMVIRDVFVAQQVRENPPPVEIPKDLAARLRKREDLELDDDIDATLDAQRFEQLHTTYVKQPPRSVLKVIAEENNRLLVLTGEPGSGKSTLLRYLLTGIIEPPIDQQSGEPLIWTSAFKDAFPLLIELRDFYAQRQRNECDTFLEYVAYMGKTDQWFLDDHAVHDYLENGSSLVMFDGLDEIFDLTDRERVMHEITGFSQRYPHTRIIVTSRPVGYREHILRNAGFAHFGMQDLDDEQIETFIRGWFALTFPQQPQLAEQRIERVLGSLKQSKSIRLLAGNPLLLTIMALLAREEELPRERAKFYEKAVEVLCHHWDANRNLQLPEERYLNADDKKALLRRIAIRMQTGAGGLSGNVIQQEDLEQEIQHYLIDAQWQPNAAEARQAARRMIGQLRERNYILCLRGPNLYGFVHRTFLEYLTAGEYVRRFDRQPQQMTFEELLGLFDQHCRDDDWREVLRLICGQIDEQFVGQIVERLATRIDLEQWDGKIPLPELPLAIWCLGEVRNTANLGQAGDTLLAAIVSLFQTDNTNLGPLILGELIASTKEMSFQWPGQRNIPYKEKLLSRFDLKLLYWPQFVAAILKDRTVIEELTVSEEGSVKAGALKSLSEIWPDEATRMLLLERAVQDTDNTSRATALAGLARIWPDDVTRVLLTERSVQDKHEIVRGNALAALVDVWPEEDTHILLKERAFVDGVATSLVGKQHSKFGQILFAKDFNEIGPYLDPAKPIPREHIEKAAKKANVSPARIDELVQSLSEHMGWDITKGSAG